MQVALPIISHKGDGAAAAGAAGHGRPTFWAFFFQPAGDLSEAERSSLSEVCLGITYFGNA